METIKYIIQYNNYLKLANNVLTDSEKDFYNKIIIYNKNKFLELFKNKIKFIWQ